MNLNNMKIGSQLKIGFTLLMLFVLVLGTVSYIQTDQIFHQVQTIYQHPLQVRRAIGALNADILTARLATRELMLAGNKQEQQAAIQLMELSTSDAVRQFDIIERQYLGPPTDVDEAFKAFINWKSVRDMNTKLALSGEIESVKKNNLADGSVGKLREEMLSRIRVIDSFAEKKAAALYANSETLKISLNRQLIVLVAIILLLSFIINYVLLRNIRKPLRELTDKARLFHEGDMDARSSYESINEFGELSSTFNTLAGSIQGNIRLNKNVENISTLMLSEDDAVRFFHTTLAALASNTGAQLAAVYLLSDDKKTFEHFDSIGMDSNARPSFAADSFEGEFGSALASGKVQHINAIPDDTRFVFHTASGTFIPREILTIPIIDGSVVIAVISLATVTTFDRQSILLIDTILDTLSARVAGILAYRKVREFSTQLEQQNRELESQKTELSSQTTELITQNAELEMQKKQLGEASRLKTNFLSNMSHELRTPLNSVIALSGVLGRRLADKIPEEEYSYLEVIERNGKHLLMQINDILDIARIEAGREEVEITRFNVKNLVGEIIGMLKPQAEQQDIKLLYTGSETDLTIASDAGKCRHILQNLIGNAVKFTENGGVEISVLQSGDEIKITVADTGIGIEETNLAHIFDEFRQADGSTSRKFGGTGLGLAIAKKYANLLGGAISVKSTLGRGSEFTLTLPLHYAAENRITEAETGAGSTYEIKRALHKPVSGSPEKTILLVEDSEPAIIQLTDILEESGYQLLVARDGAEALGIIAQTIPDAMVLDLMMPGIDGFEVLQTIREAERTTHIPVLILTAKHITKEELRFLKRNNVRQLIQKGDVNRNELKNAVAAMVFPETAEQAKPVRKLQTIEGKPVVLVVEDNPDNMITVKALLDGKYTFIGAANGHEGIEMAKKHIPNLILMDIALPGLDGIEAFKTIRQDPRLLHIPIIALTASAMTSDRETILSHGFDAYIAKPIDEKPFLKSLHEALYGS